MIYYPLTAGANTDEILRPVEAVQPPTRMRSRPRQNWPAGDRVIVAPSATDKAARRGLAEGFEFVNWLSMLRADLVSPRGR